MSIKKILQDEEASLNSIHPGTPLSEIIQLVQTWESCALKAALAFNPNTPAYLAAIEHNPIAAKKEFSKILKNNWIFALAKCACHYNLAAELVDHPNPIVRTACTKHYDIALILRNDANQYVRNACCQWMDILESLQDDPAEMVRSRQIASSKKMAIHYLNHGTAADKALAIHLWNECLMLAMNSDDPQLKGYSTNIFYKTENAS